MDIEVQRTLMNPTILSSEAWEPYTHYSKAADGKFFKTDLVTKKEKSWH